MEGTVKISLEDYEKLRDVEKAFEAKQAALDSERADLLRKLDFSRITTTVWTHFLMDYLGIDKSLTELVEAFNKKGTSVRLELKTDGDRTYIVAIEKNKEYL